MLRKIGMKLKIEAASTELTDLLVEKRPQPDHEIIEKKRSDFLYFRARAISAGDFGPKKGEPNPNGNGDYFPKAELEKSYSTFEGRNLFLNHESDHPVKSIGKILSAEIINDPETGEVYVECLSKIDKKLHPEIARKVETGELDTVSMGCSCQQSQCSICGHILETDDDVKCAHLDQGLLKTFSAEIDMPEYGIHKGKPSKAFAINTGLEFNELSIVNVPADASAFIKGVIASNIKNKISKKASLDETEVSFLPQLLAQLDEPTKTKIKAEFCGICPPSQEEKSMSDKSKSQAGKVSEAKSVTGTPRTEQDEMREMLSGLDAYKYMQMANMFEKKFKQAEVEENNFKTAGEACSKCHKKLTDEEHDSGYCKTCADKKEGSEKKEDESFLQSVLDKAKNSMAGKIFAQTIRRLVESETGPKPQPSITAKFNKSDDLRTSTWTINASNEEKPIIVATLGDIWGDQLTTQDLEYIISDTYGTDLVSFYNQEGLDKTSILLGIKAYEQMNVKDTKVSTPKNQDFKMEQNAKEEKAAEKSSEAMTQGESEAGKHLEPEKKIQEASEVKKAINKKTAKHAKDCKCAFCKNMKKDGPKKKDKDKKEDKKEDKKKGSKKKADMIDEVTPDPESPSEATPEESPMSLNMGEESAEQPEEKTLFDEVDKVTVGDGFEAKKDLETKEIVITNAQGQEVKRIPDAFGHDMPAVIDLLRDLMNLASSDEGAPEGAPAVPEVAEEPGAEEPAPSPEEAGAYAAKQKALTKEADELKKQKEALDQEKRALETKKAEMKVSHFGSAVSSRVEKCRTVVQAMFDRDMLEIDEDIYQENLDLGATVIEARDAARKHAASRQLENLLGMDPTSLEAFTKTLTRVQKKAGLSTLKTAVHMPYPEEEGDEISDIFGSMGSGGGRSKFDV